ncbi:hypothetical protein D3C73_20590 [compost metagenome]
MTVRTTGALVDVGELRKSIREIDLLSKRQVQNEPRAESTPPPSDGTASNQRSQSAASAPHAATADNKDEFVSSAPTGIQPLPVIDTSPISYPSLTVPAFGAATAASVVNVMPTSVNTPLPGAAIEPSPVGWRVGGVPWYWWCMGLLAISAGAWQYLYKRKEPAIAPVND